MEHRSLEEKKQQRKEHRRKRKIARQLAFERQIKEHKVAFIWYLILRCLVLLAMSAQFFNKNYENVFLCILTLLLFLVPSIIENNFHIDVPDTLEIIILLFIFAAEILGEINYFYIIFPFWDTVLHTLNGFLAAAIGFSLVDILNRNESIKFNLSPIFMAVVAFCFSMTIGVLWEFFEYGMDHFLGFDMQKDTIITTIRTVMLDPLEENHVVSMEGIKDVMVNNTYLNLGGYLDIGLIDTMKDLFVNFIGAVVFSIIGFFYIKHRGKGRFAKHFIPTLIQKHTILEDENEANRTNGE